MVTEGAYLMKKFLVASLLFIVSFGRDISALTLGNFTAQDFIIRVATNKKVVLRDNFILDDQHYTDLGIITKDELPLMVRVWNKGEQNLDENSLLSEFIIEDVPRADIYVNTSDVWLMYSDENGDLQITNMADQSLAKESSQPSSAEPAPPALAQVEKVPQIQVGAAPEATPKLAPLRSARKTMVLQEQTPAVDKKSEELEKLTAEPETAKAIQTESIPLISLETATPEKNVPVEKAATPTAEVTAASK